MKKYLIITLLFGCTTFSFTQTFECQYTGDHGQIYQISDNEYVYGILDENLKRFNVYSLDHNLLKMIPLTPDSASYFPTMHLSKTLFNDDSKFELLYDFQANNTTGVKVVNEDGTELFSEPMAWDPLLCNTDQRAKMLLTYPYGPRIVKVFSLYGQVLKIDENGKSSDSHLFPNPSTGKINVEYDIPDGEHNLVLTVYSLNGSLIDQVNVSSFNKQIQYNASLLQPGIYLYRIHNNSFSTTTKKFVVKK
jgi:hypothetical protein